MPVDPRGWAEYESPENENQVIQRLGTRKNFDDMTLAQFLTYLACEETRNTELAPGSAGKGTKPTARASAAEELAGVVTYLGGDTYTRTKDITVEMKTALVKGLEDALIPLIREYEQIAAKEARRLNVNRTPNPGERKLDEILELFRAAEDEIGQAENFDRRQRRQFSESAQIFDEYATFLKESGRDVIKLCDHFNIILKDVVRKAFASPDLPPMG